MIELIRKKKWVIHWSTFTILILTLISVAIVFHDKSWLGHFLQTIGTISGIYLTIIVFLASKADSDRQSREHLEHLQALNRNQIEELRASTERQLSKMNELHASQVLALQESTKKQIDGHQKLNLKHIDALHESTEKQVTSFQGLTSGQIEAIQNSTKEQIEAIQKATYEEISAFERQLTEVTNQLSDNSLLLAEILGRELEKAIDNQVSVINSENRKYNDLSRWKLLRTPEEREAQLNNQYNRIQQIEKGYQYLLSKNKQVKHFLGIDDTKRLS